VTDGYVLTIDVTPEQLRALAHLPRCGPLVGGKCQLCDVATSLVVEMLAAAEMPSAG
jgi:hypothetical protein